MINKKKLRKFNKNKLIKLKSFKRKKLELLFKKLNKKKKRGKFK